MLNLQIQNYWSTEEVSIVKRDFTRFYFKMG